MLLLARGLALPAQANDKEKDSTTTVVATTKFATLHIPRLEVRPTLADFLEMQPSQSLAAKMLKVDGFQQRDPKDGAPISQKTEVYLGYTDKNIYVVCVCFDSEPGKIRARLGRRELINDDDQFGFVLDTFHDHYHGLFFYVNPLGVQQDGIWVDRREGRDPSIVVCDRANNTLQYFTMDGKYLQTLTGYGLPANAETWKNLLVIPELHARITLLNEKNEVVARLGDDVARITGEGGMQVRGNRDAWKNGKFVHPHDACFGQDGSIFVAEWVATGRISKLKRLS